MRRDESGAALVEMALVLPILLIVVFGILEFGRAINYWIDTTHLANQAARFAAVNKNPNGSGTLAAYIAAQGTTQELRNGGTQSVPNALTVTLCFPAGTSKVGDPVRAVVSTTYNWMPFLGLSATSSTLKGTATMRIEVPPTAYTGTTTCPA
ncbi:TadE/TadG family type IV pilus assembly protein [Paraconexibacter sp.]|uniref:TadE/TadG family type IV pilus assembly protein n=1 Tax=Paraconexibacter sp. TaxID=2949640 RepID=UPI00356A7F2D